MSDRDLLFMRIKSFGGIVLGLWMGLILLRYLPAPRDYWDFPVIWASLLLVFLIAVSTMFCLVFALVGVWCIPGSMLETLVSVFRRKS